MTNPAFAFAVDLNNDGDFSDANEDISAYIVSASWQIGFSTQYDIVARDSTATIVLRNNSKRFSPESGSVFSANWTKGKKIRIQSTDPTTLTVRTMYLGWVDSILPEPGVYEGRTCTVRCISFFQRIQQVEAFVPLQESRTADQVISDILGNIGIYPPGLPSLRWLIGVPGYSEIGTTTYFGSTTDYLTAETGKTTFNYIGDKWGAGVNVLQALRDTVGREGGRLYLSRDGILTFINRHHLILDSTSDETFNGTMNGLSYSYGATVFNKVTVKARPRKVGNAPEVLSRLDKAIPIKPFDSFTFTFRYSDLTASGAKVGGRSPITPVQTTDYTANDSELGTGVDYTASVTALVTRDLANGCEVKFTNAAAVQVWIQAGATLRATAIRDFGSQSYTAQDDDSVLAYGLYPYTYSSEMDNLTDAQGMAELRVIEWRNPRGSIKAIELPARANATLLTAALARTLFDRITITEAQTGTSQDHFIISEHHEIKGKSYRCSWGVEPAANYQFWLIGVTGFSEIGVTTFFGPY